MLNAYRGVELHFIYVVIHEVHANPKVLEWSDLLGVFSHSSPPFIQVDFFHCLWGGLVLKYLFLQFLVYH